MYQLFKRAHVPGMFQLQMAGTCDPGIARDHNEDAIAVHTQDEKGYWLALVCDGMGGHNAGELASALATETIVNHVAEHFGKEEPESLLDAAFIEAGKRIDQQSKASPDNRGMGCTAVVVLGTRERAWVAHAGDSRVYLMRDSELSQVTIDHTVVQEMVQQGLLTEAQAATHPYRGRISRCLGHGIAHGRPDVREIALEPGDRLLLCSDGLSDVVEHEQVEEIMKGSGARLASERLVAAANEAGGPDNISAMILHRVE